MATETEEVMLTHKQMVSKVMRTLARCNKRIVAKDVHAVRLIMYQAEVKALEWVLKDVLKP